MSSSDTLNSTRHSSTLGRLKNAYHSWLAKPRSRKVVSDIVGLFDALAIVIGGLVPAQIYNLSGPGVISGWFTAVQWSLVVAIIVHLGMRHFKLFDTAKMHDFPMAPGKIALCLGLGFMAVLGIGLPFTASEAHMWIWYAAWATTSFTLLVGNRILANYLLARMTRAGSFNRRIAVYGAGNIAARLDKYLRNPDLGISFAGVFDDRTDDARSATDGPKPTGRMEDLIEAGRKGDFDQIIIALPQAADHRTAHIARKLEQLPVSVHVCTHISSDLVDDDAVRSVSHVGPVGLLDVKQKPLSHWAPFLKSAEDYALGTVLLIMAVPIFILTAVAIKLDSSGPVFFKQRRRGLNQNIFEVIKFRTMTVQEDGNDVVQAKRDDPRTTRVGRLLRRTSIDELPQLINVLKGEMSLVGPRPHALTHDEQYSGLLQTYANRHQVKPGMTGLAQVNGYRGETKTPEQMQKRVDLDLDYIRNWSLALDFKILSRTMLAVSLNKNAY